MYLPSGTLAKKNRNQHLKCNTFFFSLKQNNNTYNALFSPCTLSPALSNAGFIRVQLNKPNVPTVKCFCVSGAEREPAAIYSSRAYPSVSVSARRGVQAVLPSLAAKRIGLFFCMCFGASDAEQRKRKDTTRKRQIMELL